MTFGSLFAGIGGLDLGFERSGMSCKWQVEIDPYARRVLAKHWPDVTRHDDIKTFPPSDPSDWAVDLICGGFPCQDISFAGKGAGLAGERSGLWFEYARVVREIRPRFVLVENVAGLAIRGIGDVLGSLASLGYDAEWHCIQAASVGLPHARERIYVIANRDGVRKLQPKGKLTNERRWRGNRREAVDWILSRGGVLRGPNGVSCGVDRIRGLGNAVVPQVAEWIGRRIIESAQAGIVER